MGKCPVRRLVFDLMGKCRGVPWADARIEGRDVCWRKGNQ